MTSDIAKQFEAMGRRVKNVKVETEPVFKVWDMNWPAVAAFLALQTQWRVASLSTYERARLVPTGLDYAVVPQILTHLRIKKRRRVFAQLQILEHAALATYQELAA